jgi:NAD(P)-dependent dehydrogenase (short-subunit alcohol dehydrogenase family)
MPPDGHAAPDRLFDVAGRSAIVTGACGPIGQAIAAALRQRGAAVTAVDADPAIETVAAGLGALAVRADVSDPGQVDQAVAAADNHGGGIDMLVNNAGINAHGGPLDVELSAWNRILAVNLTGYFLMARAVARVQRDRQRPAAIVNISSTASSSALGRGNLAYSVSKAGVDQLTRELAVELSALSIRVNAIQPAQVSTPAWLAVAQDPQTAPRYDRVVSGIPLGRLVEPAELVGPVLFLLSPAASMVTGAVLPVDGGNLAFNAAGSLPA